MLENLKPAITVKVADLNNFTRLALAVSEESPLIWHFKMEESHILGILTAYMYWQGDIPIFAYITMEKEPAAFLAYSSNALKGEEAFFTSTMDDTRYRYSPLIDTAQPPEFIDKNLAGKVRLSVKPVLTELAGLSTLARTLLFLSIDEPAFPLWRFKRKDQNILGTIIPFEHYYESDALPVFFYVIENEKTGGNFLKYSTSKPRGEFVEYAEDTADPKYFYVKIVEVDDLPFFP
jgi:hypothetical protein